MQLFRRTNKVVRGPAPNFHYNRSVEYIKDFINNILKKYTKLSRSFSPPRLV